MFSLGQQPDPDDEPDERYLLTFVVPAANGCNLKCPFCLIEQREEIAETRLRPHDYARFVRDASERYPIFAVVGQGYEPLLPEALDSPGALCVARQGAQLTVRNTMLLERDSDWLKTNELRRDPQQMV
jgi:molybdenum cofactor biosynthesis enzyme MoaA